MISLEELQAGIVLPLDKPRQWTSFQAVNKVKSVVRSTYGLKKFKIGHAGTLDPLATGLLLVCIGKATKTIPQLQDGDKVYTGRMVLGATTPCFDLERAIDRYYPYEHVTQALLDEVRLQFDGTVMQVPPMFSAVKIDGQRAYEYARIDDPSATIQPRPVTIYDLELKLIPPESPLAAYDFDPSISSIQPTAANTQLYQNPQGEVPAQLPQIEFSVHCGKGTYIRSLARDIGAALGSGAFLASLRREKIGDYTVADAIHPNDVANFLTAC